MTSPVRAEPERSGREAGPERSGPLRLAGAELADTSPDGRVLTFSLDGSRTPAGELVAALASAGGLRDISINEPAIEDVIARRYAAPAQLPRTLG